MIKNKQIIAIALLFILSIVIWIVFYPGFMSVDSINQYLMSKSFDLNDWHPPIMVLVWAAANKIFPEPSGMLAVQLFLLLISVYIWWGNYKNRKFSWLFFLIPILPWVFNFSGVLWKDVSMAFVLFALSGLALRKPMKRTIFLAFILVFYAINLRHNALFAVLPILVFLSFRWLRDVSIIKALVYTIAVLYICVFLGGVLNYNILDAEKTKPSNYMMVDDLAYISIRNNESLLPGLSLREIQECSTAVIGETRLVGRVFCFSGLPQNKGDTLLTIDLKSTWFTAVLQNPIDYVEFRLAAFSYLLRAPSEKPYYVWHRGITENPYGLKFDANGFTTFADNYVNKSASIAPFLFKPYFWLACSLFLFGASFFLTTTTSLVVIRTLLASSVLYTLGYIPVTPMADFRYVYWSVLATTLAIVILIVDWPRSRANISNHLIYINVFISVFLGLAIYSLGKLPGSDMDRVLSMSMPEQRVSVGMPITTFDLENSDMGYKVKGIDPFLVYDISSFKLATQGVTWLEFNFYCSESGTKPILQFFWWGDEQLGPIEAQSLKRAMNNGINLVPLQSISIPRDLSAITGIRLDLENSDECKEIKFENISLIE